MNTPMILHQFLRHWPDCGAYSRKV